ncbi:ABC transporter ATP-binding protein [Acidovorax sp. Root267]|uniref:peptidase domain-containing ABC transporter n=1 Tax=Acidovorax sp. Root267 TaxID=1736505 RepID=UPI00070DCF5A|nr:peptidase domain-containing ABC transporter [Acidovorax sp. Root267]KRD19901.1 ABC transporter ATP-binding protein [Acidovorax sp. Root267]
MSSLALLTGGRRLPVILQAEAAECGLTSVAMLAIYHGHRFEMSDLRRRMPVSSKGTTLESLVAIAETFKLDTRALKLDLDALDQLVLPCIVHWDMNHFVVLKHVSRRFLVVHDPAVGERRLGLEEFSRHFTGVAMELKPAANFSPVDVRKPLRLRTLVGNVVGLRRNVLHVLGLGVALEVVAVAMPFHLQWVVDQALPAADRDLITALSAGFALLVLLHAGIAALRGWLVATLSANLNFQWLGNVFAHLLKLPLAYFEKRHLGTIQSYFSSIGHIQQMLTSGFAQAVVDGILTLGTVAMMLTYSATLTGVAGMAVLGYAVVRRVAFSSLRNASVEEIVWDAKQHTHFLETVRGIQAVRLFSRLNERRMGWLNMLADKFNAHLRVEKIGVIQHTSKVLIFGLENVLIIWLAGLAVLRTDFTLGMLFAFLAYKAQFSQRTAALVDKLFEFSMLRLHTERLADIVQSTPEQDSVMPEIDLSLMEASIEVRGVSFRYSSNEPLVLDKVNLSIAAGECVAITGASGCGKTTLTKILLGLLEPSDGDVFLAAHSLRRVGLTNYRKLIGAVMQDDTLYTGSIADNISFFDPQPDAEYVEECARMAAIHEEIIDMPMGYNSLVGDIGSGLSGGQKQRICLARALYRRPRILVLDEATSHLDILNERTINETIKSMKLTRIIIAHRPETINMTDRVIVLEKGRVAQDGV